MNNWKILALLGAMALGSLFSNPLLGADAPHFGVIDVKRIFLSYKETQARKQALASQIDDLQKDIDERKKVVDELKGKIEELGKTLKPGDESLKAKKTLQDMRKLNEDYREKMDELKEMYRKYSIQLQEKEEKEIMALEKELETRVKPILEKLAADRKFFGIFEKRSVFFGGEDITQEILELLNK